ncbi:hypothetical protein P7C71_g2665, partial [Lecanoromycetidae sp. Uapishka_2]
MVNDGKGTHSDPDQGWTLWIVSVVMVIFSGMFVLARLAIRLSKQMLGADDYIIFVGLWFYGAQITYKIAVALYKESILFLYLRIFLDPKFRYMCYSLIVITGASSIAFVIVTIFQCTPVAAFWDKTILKSTPGSHCFDSEAFWFSYALINIFLDVIILLLPIREVLRLQLPWREKAGLVAVFSLGVFVCATSIIRTTTLASSSRSTDVTWGYIPPTVWSVVEANTGTICACLPMLKGPLSSLFPRVFGTNHESSSSFGKGSGNSYPLASRSKKSTRPDLGESQNSTDYHQWAMSDGRILNTKKQDYDGHYGAAIGSGRRSEDRERIIRPGLGHTVSEGKIVRTDEVNVYRTEDDDSLPSLKNQVYAG